MPVVKDSFESIERLGKKAAQIGSQVTSEVTQDVKESIFGDIKSLTAEEEQRVIVQEQAKQKRVQQMRQNVQILNQQIEEIRKKRQQKEEQKKQVEQHQQGRKYEQKQKKESVLQKLLKSREGTKEGMPRASGWYNEPVCLHKKNQKQNLRNQRHLQVAKERTFQEGFMKEICQ